MTVSQIKPLDFLVGNYDKYIVIGASSPYTLEVFNVNTNQEETIEGDYLENGDISNMILLNKGNAEVYVKNMNEKAFEYKKMLTEKINEIKDFYLN